MRIKCGTKGIDLKETADRKWEIMNRFLQYFFFRKGLLKIFSKNFLIKKLILGKFFLDILWRKLKCSYESTTQELH